MTSQTKRLSKGIYIGLAIAIVSLGFAILGGVYFYRQADEYKEELHNTYMRAFHDMSDYLNDIDIGLKKTMLAQDAPQLSALSAQLYMQAEAAKSCLGQLPIEDASFDNTSKFLSQTGDYASYLSRKVIQNETVTEEEYENLGSLSEYAEAVNEEFSKLEDKIYENSMNVESIKVSNPFVAYAEDESFKDGMQRLESMPQEYPSLIYDGPFSEHLEDAEPQALKDKQTVSRRTAESVVKLFLGEERAKQTAYESDGSGTLDTYLFSGNTDSGSISIEVTKQGGMVLWMLDSREVKESRLSVEQAMTAGALFLSQRGFPSMKSSYYDVADNIATINYAYQQDGVTMYPDLIKVKIALDNGEVLGFEAQGYLMCHREREIPDAAISEDAARQKIGTHLLVGDVSMAYIPLESKREVFCYELSGTLGKHNFLIYVNAQTGGIEKILMLLESENGILTL